jgi:hypothetical protein
VVAFECETDEDPVLCEPERSAGWEWYRRAKALPVPLFPDSKLSLAAYGWLVS